MAKGNLTVDADLVRSLAALLRETGLNEIEYAQGDQRIRVVGGTPAAAAAAAPAAVGAPAVAAPRPEAAGTIKAPMVGTVYLAPQPGSAPFVSIGDSVREGQVLLIIEAMKVMNHIHAPRTGRVAEILIAEGAPVEYGQALLILE
jgi:acetyl-CoA carboxylase biotin carboxyl carrier protein